MPVGSNSAMELERKEKKRGGKKGAARKSSTVEEYLAEQAEAQEMDQEVTNGTGFDSLRTALLQCIQVRDQETLSSLLLNDVIAVN